MRYRRESKSAEHGESRHHGEYHGELNIAVLFSKAKKNGRHESRAMHTETGRYALPRKAKTPTAMQSGTSTKAVI